MRVVLIALSLLLLPGLLWASHTYKIDQNPTFSADGRYIAFERTGGGLGFTEIVVLDLARNRSAAIAGELLGTAPGPSGAVTATGSQYAAVIRNDGKVMSTVWNLGAGTPHITGRDFIFSHPHMQNGRLRFRTQGVDYVTDWELNPATGAVKALSRWKNREPPAPVKTLPAKTPPRLNDAIGPALSPDGSLVALSSKSYTGDVTNERQNIYLINRDGSGLKRLTTSGGTHPVWHPNGKGLAYITPKGDIAWINRDGSEGKILVRSAPTTKMLRWHPDGKQLMVQAHKSNEIAWYAMTPPSNKLTRITKPIRIPPNVNAVLSPKGDKAAWAITANGLIQLSVATPKTVRHHNFKVDYLHHPSLTPALSWTEDGKRFAASVEGGLWLVDAATGKRKILTREAYEGP